MADDPQITIRKMDLAWEITDKLTKTRQFKDDAERTQVLLETFKEVYEDISKTVGGTPNDS